MDIIATIGPQLTLNKIAAIIDAGATILRINGAHSTGASAAALISDVRRHTNGRARIMIDLPTNKIRTENIVDPIAFDAGERFFLHAYQLNFPQLSDVVRLGDEVIVNDGFNHLAVTGVENGVIQFEANSPGRLGNNRGLIFARDIYTEDFPFLFKRDLELIEVINDMGVELVGVSYLRHPKDKEEVRCRVADPESLVYKIETRAAFRRYEEMILPGERILIDRGDLAGEIGLIHIPQAQDRIIRWAHRHRVEVHCATQFLAAMVHSPIPHISEVCALYETLKLGVSGVQLSEETAVGEHPVAAVEWIRLIEALVTQEGRICGGSTDS